VNKRFLRHLLFWLAYCIQETLIEYAWIHGYYDQNHQAKVVLQAIWFCISLLPGKIAFTYWVLYKFTPQALNMRGRLPVLIPQFIIAFLVAIFIHRLAGNYILMAELNPGKPVDFSEVYNPNKVFVSLLDTGYVAGIAVALKLFRMQIEHLRNEKDLVREKLGTELKFLKNQINPHFLFNTLNNIYSLSRKKSDKAPEIVLKLSKLLRFILYESGKDTITIAEEIRILEDYVELEKIRYNDRLKLTFDKQIDDTEQLITPLILLPFIENAFKHGVSETTEETCIAISIVLKNGNLSFFVNNSKEYDGANDVREKIGLSNVRRQLELMYRDFTLVIDNLADNFNVDLKINLNSHAAI